MAPSTSGMLLTCSLAGGSMRPWLPVHPHPARIRLFGWDGAGGDFRAGDILLFRLGDRWLAHRALRSGRADVAPWERPSGLPRAQSRGRDLPEPGVASDARSHTFPPLCSLVWERPTVATPGPSRAEPPSLKLRRPRARSHPPTRGDWLGRADAPVAHAAILGRVASVRLAGRWWNLENAPARLLGLATSALIAALTRIGGRKFLVPRSWFPVSEATPPQSPSPGLRRSGAAGLSGEGG